MFKKNWLVAAAIAAVVVIAGIVIAFSPLAEDTVDEKTAFLEKLMEVGPLPDMALGDEDAPVTIVEYASLTCPHCALFHNQVFPTVKREYIDTGKVRWVFREFPLDAIATSGSMLARCADPKHYFGFIDIMFAQHEDEKDGWLSQPNPMEGLQNIARQGGFTAEQFADCNKNQELLDGINWIYKRASEEFDVRSTPTFFINDRMLRGAVAYEGFHKCIDWHLDGQDGEYPCEQ